MYLELLKELLNTVYAEYALIFFTTFAQLAIGLTVFAVVASSISQEKLALKLWRSSLLCIIIAGGASVLHLQNPMNAFYTITQVVNSWMSREIVCVGIFSGLLFWQSVKGNKLTGYITLFIGLIVIYVMAEVYASVITMPMWGLAGTLLAFFGTTFLLGGAFSLILVRNIDSTLLKRAALSSIILGIFLSLSAKMSWVNIALTSAQLSIPDHYFAGFYNSIIYVVCLLLGSLLLIYKKSSRFPILLSFVFLLFFVAEIMGRSLFFLAQFKIGV